MTPRVWAYTLARNEATLIPFWVRHYCQFCERVIVYDEASDDGTPDLARAEGAEVRPYTASVGLDDFAWAAFASQQYREARGQADYVVWADADEFLWHPHLAERLAALHAEGVQIPTVAGYAMVAGAPPTGDGQITDLIRQGVPARAYSKACLIDPELSAIWGPGKHTLSVGGGARCDDGKDPLRLLHYRGLGEAWLRARNERNMARQNQRNREAGHGAECRPGATGDYSAAWYLAMGARARDVVGEAA